ncbi:structure-specific endonuclease subunit SLX1-like [Rhododendron vialii]|uniref:structure-specific endonuclease subunit SLX1-like n=1 Tax=Rhododendron vialii TaxID=182163 RepID=UPI0026602DE8|nr:structure-specific endonuclease subunit SLX1-like [Rhododendron vialii]
MTRLLSKSFPSLKPHHIHHRVGSSPNPNSVPYNKPSQNSPSSPLRPFHYSPSPSSSSSTKHPWAVYLILSTNTPIKTYVGVTTNFSRRLRQHNDELKGGAKASRVGRPWVCACIIQGFMDRSEACAFESKWKIFSRKLPRKMKIDETEKQLDNESLLLLRHRQAALNRVKSSIDGNHLEIHWQLDPW